MIFYLCLGWVQTVHVCTSNSWWSTAGRTSLGIYNSHNEVTDYIFSRLEGNPRIYFVRPSDLTENSPKAYPFSGPHSSELTVKIFKIGIKGKFTDKLAKKKLHFYFFFYFHDLPCEKSLKKQLCVLI